MDLTIDQSTLGRALRLVARITPAKAALPILQMVLLEAEPSRLRLTAADGELGVTITLAADVAAAGRAAIPARLLSEYVSQLPAEPLRLTLDSGTQRVRAVCDRFQAALATADPEDFPVFPAADDAQALELDGQRLQDAITRVAFAASRDQSRPVLSCVLFDLGPEGLSLAAADSFRLARSRVPEAVGATRQLLVPARAAVEFGRLLDGGEAARLVPTPDGRGLYLRVKETTLFTQLMDGRFPDIERVIPQEWTTRVTIETTAFRQAVRVASLFGAGEARPVRLDAEAGRLHLHARGDDVGDAHSEIAVRVEGEPGAVVLNTRLLADLLDAASGPHLDMAWTSPQAPVVVRQTGQPEAGDLWVIMPLYDAALMQRQTQV
ncbi:MAG: DNA polymerase III subunit beta [Chloroflexi bacterium]|nr:DNA polymerase III subunit beta [Chloroflexota bacterium]